MMLNRNFSHLFPIELVEKDLSYVTSTTEASLAEAVRRMFAKAKQKGYCTDRV